MADKMASWVTRRGGGDWPQPPHAHTLTSRHACVESITGNCTFGDAVSRGRLELYVEGRLCRIYSDLHKEIVRYSLLCVMLVLSTKYLHNFLSDQNTRFMPSKRELFTNIINSYLTRWSFPHEQRYQDSPTNKFTPKNYTKLPFKGLNFFLRSTHNQYM